MAWLGRKSSSTETAKKTNVFNIGETYKRIRSIWTKSGEIVREEEALGNEVVFACMRVLCESNAITPIVLKQAVQDDSGQHERITTARNHPLYRILHDRPNPDTTAYEFVYNITFDMLAYGRAAVHIQRDATGRILNLYNLIPDKLHAFYDNGELSHYVYGSGLTDPHAPRLDPKEIMIVELMSQSGGVRGLNLISEQKELIGSSNAAEAFASRFWKNNGAMTATLEMPEDFDPDAAAIYVQAFKDQRESNQNGVIVLENGVRYNQQSVDFRNTQFLEGRQYQRSLLAGIFRVPEFLISSLNNATFSNIEHQSLSFVQYSLMGYFRNIEQRLNMCLLSDQEIEEGYFFKFNTLTWMKGDNASRAQYMSTMVAAGILTPNDCRRAEDYNPIEGGDDLYINGGYKRITGENLPDDVIPEKEDNAEEDQDTEKES